MSDKALKLTPVKIHPHGTKLRLLPKISLYGKKINIRQPLDKEYAEALRERMR